MDEETAPPGSPSLPAPIMPGTIVSLPHITQSPSSPFLDLPPELRNEIYKWLFPTGNSAVQLLARNNGGYISMSDRLGLLATCRQVYNETSSLLRGQQRFAIVQSKTLFEVMDANQEIEDMIFNYFNPGYLLNIIYDLDSQTIHNDETNIMYVSHGFRSRIAYYFDICITATTSTTDGLENLKHRRRSDYFRIPVWIPSGSYQYHRIVLRFPRPSGDRATALCIEATELLYATRDLPSSFYVSVVLVGEDEMRTEDDKHLMFIRASLLLFVHTIIRKTSSDAHAKIWINKDLGVSYADVEHQDGVSHLITNNYAERSEKEIVDLVYGGDMLRHYYNVQDPRPVVEFGTTGVERRGVDTQDQDTLLRVAERLAKSLMGEFL